jgi:transglutaminase-like putative cysteine protease
VAVLLAAVLRQCGLAARLTSGYLREADAESKRAEGSLHAWTEVYLPGAGWVGMDPTNGVFSNHNFIAAAVGIAPGDVTPIDGSFYPRQATSAQMTSRLELVSL